MFLLSVVAFVVVFGLVVLVHEAGHFLVARRAGIRVLEFGLGYPPRLKTLGVRNGVEYTLNALPLGGFVRMLGEEDPSDPESFASKSARARIGTLLAGPAMNFVLAAIIFAGLLMFVGRGIPTGQVQVQSVALDSPALHAGLRSGDVIVQLAGHEITSAVELAQYTRAALGQEVELAFLRDGERISVRLIPRVNPPQGQGAMGIVMGEIVRQVRYPMWEAIPLGLLEAWKMVILVAASLISVLRGAVPVQEIAGPIGIAQASGEVARLGLLQLLEFTAGISVNLAFINVLPLPILDGGRALLILVEKLQGGKRLAPQRQVYAQLISLMLILSLVLVFSYFDVVRILAGQRILR